MIPATPSSSHGSQPIAYGADAKLLDQYELVAHRVDRQDGGDLATLEYFASDLLAHAAGVQAMA